MYMKYVSVKILDVSIIEQNEEYFMAKLDAAQREKAFSYKQKGDRLLSIGSSYLLNEFTPPSPLYFGEKGKPQKKGIYFNLSHSARKVVFASSDCDVGVDVEKVRSVNEKLIKKVCSPIEAESVKNDKDFFFVWTMKESLLKCLGSGLISDLTKVPSLPIGEKAYLGESYYSCVFDLCDYVLAITVKGREKPNIEIEKIQ